LSEEIGLESGGFLECRGQLPLAGRRGEGIGESLQCARAFAATSWYGAMARRHNRRSKRDMGSLQLAHRVARRAASRFPRSRSRRGQTPLQRIERRLPRLESERFFITIGSSQPIEDAACVTYRELIRWMTADFGFEELDAYMLLTQYRRIRLGKWSTQITRWVHRS
jgi:hypothetical protein